MLTSFLLLVTILMLSLAKEGIIHCLHFCISSYVIFSLSLLSSVFTTIYSIKILVYCFNYVLFVYSGYLSIIVPVLTLSSLLIDESLDLDLVKYTSAHFSIIVWIAHFYAIFLYYVISRNPLLTLDPLILCSVQTFIFPLLSFCSLILSSYFFKGPIHCIEVFTGYSSCYSYYHSHYLSNLQLISFMLVALLALSFLYTIFKVIM